MPLLSALTPEYLCLAPLSARARVVSAGGHRAGLERAEPVSEKIVWSWCHAPGTEISDHAVAGLQNYF